MDRRQADVRREEILRATARVVAQKGFARTRVADIASVLGISSGLIFYHFDTKERLLSEAYSAGNQRDLQVLREIVSSSEPAISRLAAVMRMYLPTGSGEAWVRDVDAWSEGLHTDEIRQACRRNDGWWRDALRTLIVQAVAAGQCRADDPDQAALRITVMLDGLAVASDVRGTLSRERALSWAAGYTATVLGISTEVLEAAEDEATGGSGPVDRPELIGPHRVGAVQ